MVKKKEIELNTSTNILTPLEDIMSDRFGRYSKYIIQERALPDARDGLKPVQRRILYAMYHDGNVFEKQHRKSAKTVGLVIGNYHPHGDSSVYDAMVRMSQSWKMKEPLIDMHGNNGSIDDDPAAAMRYTEARLAKITGTMLEDIDYETVLFAPNFDDTEEEPTVLPSRFPLLLVNGATGIAAGYATNIAPHNLNEVIDATIYRIQNPNSTLEELIEIVKGPDFPTGGIVQGKQGIVDAFKTGKGRVVVRAKTEIVDAKSINQIIITEIPYEVIKSNLVKKMDDVRINKEIDGILDVRDETDRTGLKIVVDIKKDVDANLILNYLFKNTDLQVYYNYNMVAIVNKRPVLMSLQTMLDAFIAHREEVVLNRSKYLYKRKEERCHILEGLMKAVSIMDEIIDLIRASKDKQDAKSRLMESFLFSEKQAEAIVTLRLYRLTSTDIKQLREEFAVLVNEMELLKSIIDSNKILRSVLVKELKEIKNDYGMDRVTKIEDEVQEIVIDKTSMIANERVMITVSRDGYVKKVSLRSYMATEGQMTGLKDSDELIGALEVDTLDTLLLFTSKGNYAYLPVYELDEAKWKDVGSHLNKYVKIDADDKVINSIVVKNFDTYAWILSISRSGMIKKTPIEMWSVQRYNKLYQAMKLKNNDELLKVCLVYDNDEVVLLSKNGYVSRYSINLVPSVNTKSQGVKAMNFGKDDELVSMCTFSNQNDSLLCVTNKSLMKRIKISDIQVTSRPVKGEMITKRLKTNPYVLTDCEIVTPYSPLIFIDDEMHKLQAKDVPLMSKDATFSNPINLKTNWYKVKGIEEVKIVDKPANLDANSNLNVNEEVHDDFEMINLFND